MRLTRLSILSVTTILALGLAGYALYQNGRDTRSELPQGQALFPDLFRQANDSTELSLAQNGKHLTMVAQEGAWQLREKANYPVRPEAVRRLVLGLADLRTLEKRTDQPDNYNRLGLDDPERPGSEAIKVQLKDGKGTDLASILIGKTKTAETDLRPAELYVRRPGDAQTWLAEGHLAVKMEPTAWLDPTMIKVDRERIMSAEIESPKDNKLVVTRPNGKSEDFSFTGLPKDGKPKITSANGMMASLEAMSFDDVAKVETQPMDGAIRATIRSFDGLVVTVESIVKDGQSWATFSAALDENRIKAANLPDEGAGPLHGRPALEKEMTEINTRLGGWIYQLPDYRAENFIRKPADMVSKEKDTP